MNSVGHLVVVEGELCGMAWEGLVQNIQRMGPLVWHSPIIFGRIYVLYRRRYGLFVRFHEWWSPHRLTRN